MIKTVVFGGTFDPPHAGHKNLLRQIMRHGYDRALVIPDKIPPHKQKAQDGDDFDTRFLKTKELFADMDNVTVSDIENKREGKSFTADTLKILREQYPESELYLAMGSDMFVTVDKWFNAGYILSTTPIITAARTEADRKRIEAHKQILEKQYDCNIVIYDIDVLELSSTQLRSDIVKRIDAHNKAHLKKSRYDHVMSTANYAASIAHLHNIDPFDAYVAGIAHDCTKYLDDEKQLEYFEKHGIALTDDERDCPKIWHQISGAHFARHTLLIENDDIINAVRYHTTGRAGMSPLEKLICLCDSIEPSRDYDGVDKMRSAAERDLNEALLLSFDRLIEYIRQRGLNMNKTTLLARESIRKELENGNN